MSSRSNGPASRPVPIALCLFAATLAVALIAAATAHANSHYKVIVCAAANGADSPAIATNEPGQFSFADHCGASSNPAGEAAYLRIADTGSDGYAGANAYGSMSWTMPPGVVLLAGGGYTREPNTLNLGWRGRFWAEDFGGATHDILIQGRDATNSGVSWSPTYTFTAHLWPFSTYGSYRRFVFELTCVPLSGICRSFGSEAVDANTIVLVLEDTQPLQLHLTGTEAPPLDGQWARGTQTLTYTWSEQGSGVRKEWIDVDGARLHTIDHYAECDAGYSVPSGEFARTLKPCLTASGVERSYQLDTASLPDGAHVLRACGQDYAQWQGLDGTGSASCDERTIRTDNTPPNKPAGLEVVSANPGRYLERFDARFSLPADPGSPIPKVHYEIVNAAGEVLVPEKTVSGTNPSEVKGIEAPSRPGAYRLRVWLEDQVGFQGPAAEVAIPRDTTPPAAPQGLSVTPPDTSRGADGFDLRWRDIQDSGSPIDTAHYQVLDGAGKVVVPTQTVRGEGISAIADLQTPRQSGQFALRLWLEDAEGNAGAPVTAPLAYRCVGSDAAGGRNLSAGLGPSGAGEAVVQQGRGSVLSGRLGGDGGGVSGAALCVFSRVVTDRGREFLGLALSGPGGAYRFPIPAGASREVSVRYRAGQREVGAKAVLGTIVRPVFKVRRKVVRNRHYAQFSGYIPGPDNDNVVVVLQVRRGKGWLAFRRYRTRGGGKVTLGYRFTRTDAPTRYVMRAQVRAQAGYPYAQGNSKRLKLIVLPRRGRR
jgi:hypothetical protein